MRQLTLILCLALSFCFSCKSPEKMVDQGDYDTAIETAIRKLAGKKNKNSEHVQALELAFAKATQRDIQKIERLKITESGANWESIHKTYVKMRNRQSRIEPLLPLYDKQGVKATFKFLNTIPLEKEAQNKVASLYYQEAYQELRLGRQGDKQAARRSYRTYEKIDRFVKNYRDKSQLQREAEHLGIAHILVRKQIDAQVILPKVVEQGLLEFDPQQISGQWKAYYTYQPNDVEFDFEVVIQVNDILISPELIKEKTYTESKEIEDGFNYVLDENGNVMKDSLGNDIKIVRNVLISADVIEVYQTKTAEIFGTVSFFDVKNNRLLDQEPFGGKAIFEHTAATFQGEKEALTDRSRNLCELAPEPFPDDAFLLIEAAEHVKPAISRQLARTDLFD